MYGVGCRNVYHFLQPFFLENSKTDPILLYSARVQVEGRRSKVEGRMNILGKDSCSSLNSQYMLRDYIVFAFIFMYKSVMPMFILYLLHR